MRLVLKPAFCGIWSLFCQVPTKVTEHRLSITVSLPNAASTCFTHVFAFFQAVHLVTLTRKEKEHKKQVASYFELKKKKTLFKAGSLMIHCLSSCDLVTSKIKSFSKCWRHYFSPLFV